MIAGLARAPSRFSPLTNLEAARARRDQVLAAMVAAGYLTDDEANRWRARPVVVRQRPDFFRTTSPYFTEHVRRDVARRYGEKKLLEGGLHDRDRRGPVDRRRRPGERRLLAAQARQAAGLARAGRAPRRRRPPTSSGGASAARYGADPPVEGRLYLGLVESATAAGAARVRVGKGIYTLPSAAMMWAVPFSTRDATNGKQLESTVGVLRAGDVIWVKNAHQSSRRRFADWTYDAKSEVQWLPAYDENAPSKIRGRQNAAGAAAKPVELLLEQTPRVQGTIFSYDHDTGYVVAMVGGEDYDRSEFNRVSQACRQPGLGLQADVLLAGARQRLRLHVAAQRRAARRGRSDHGRGVDADQPQQHRRIPGDAGVRADLVEERAVGAAVQAGRRQGGREVGAPAGHHRRRSSPTRRWRWARRARASTS